MRNQVMTLCLVGAGHARPELFLCRLRSAPTRGRRAGHFELHGDGDVPTSPRQLVDAPDQSSVHLDVLEQDRTYGRPGNLGRPARRIECAILEDEVRQGRIPAIDVDLPAVMLPRTVDEVEIVQGLFAGNSRCSRPRPNRAAAASNEHAPPRCDPHPATATPAAAEAFRRAR